MQKKFRNTVNARSHICVMIHKLINLTCTSGHVISSPWRCISTVVCTFCYPCFVTSDFVLPGWFSSMRSVSEKRRTDLVVYRSDRSMWLAIMYMNCFGFVERLHSVWLVSISWLRNVTRQILLQGGLMMKWSGLTSVFRTSARDRMEIENLLFSFRPESCFSSNHLPCW